MMRFGKFWLRVRSYRDPFIRDLIRANDRLAERIGAEIIRRLEVEEELRVLREITTKRQIARQQVERGH